jgi:hypothetical protein
MVKFNFFLFLSQILPEYKEKTPDNVTRNYFEMSKQYLKCITTWCFSLAFMDIMYLVFQFHTINDLNSLNSNEINSCITIGVLLHFSLLSSFFFSLSICAIQYFLFNKCFKVYKFIYLKAILFSFGIPALIVIIVLSINKNAYINSNH